MLPAILLIFTGIGAAVLASNYGVGSFTRMGPGFIPLMLGLVLVLLGGVILWRESQATAMEAIAWRPFLAITAGILAWVILAESAGFFPAAIVQVVLSALALPRPRWRNILILAAVISAGGYWLFAVQLGVPLNAVG